MWKRWGIVVLLIATAAVIIAVFVIHRSKRPAPPPPSIVKTTTQPTSRPVVLKPKTKPSDFAYIDLVHSENPAVAATQPAAVSLDLQDAAHVRIHDPIYLDPVGHLWLTTAKAKPTNDALNKPAQSLEHLVPEVPMFVHWTSSDSGNWRAFVVVSDGHAGFDIVSSTDRQHLAGNRHYRWDSASSWDGKIVVPTDKGVSVFEIEPIIVEHYHATPGASENTSAPLIVLDNRGILAFAPWENGKPGSSAVARYVDDKWTDLAGPSWSAHFLQLIPLLDGSILQVIATDTDAVRLTVAPLESADIDQKHIADLIDQLGDPDDEKRQSAYNELAQYGPGIWPMLEKDLDNQPPETNIRLRMLLKGKITPPLSGMSLIDNRLKIIHRQSDGNALFFAPVGVQIPSGDGEPKTVMPAWLWMHSNGRIDRALPPAMVSDLSPDHCSLQRIGDEWVRNDALGVRRFIGNESVNLLHDDEKDFTQVVGIDRRGRWLFRRSSAATTQSAGETLIIDPTIPDPTLKLPVWAMRITDGTVGWTDDNWPATQRGGAWALKEFGWEPLDKNAKLITKPLPPPEANVPASQPTSQPALDSLLLTCEDGTQYFGGKNSLTQLNKNGKRVDWQLPPTAVGTSEPMLVRTADKTLYLYNQPGRLLRIKPTPEAEEPFKLEATFTDKIPNTDRPIRMWLDPAGRINMVVDQINLCILFPTGHIPPEISRMMLDHP